MIYIYSIVNALYSGSENEHTEHVCLDSMRSHKCYHEVKHHQKVFP